MDCWSRRHSRTGTADFHAQGGAVLELFGSISSDFPDAPLFVLGTTHDGTQITLPTAIHTKLSGNESTYTSSLALIGRHYASDEELVFKEIAVCYEHFSAWFDPPKVGFAIENGVSCITYRCPEETTIMDAEGIHLSVFSGYSEDVAWDRECPFQLRLHNTVRLKYSATLPKLVGLVGHFRNLITLGLGQPIGERWMRVSSVEPDSQRDVQVLYQPVSTVAEDGKYHHDRLFSFGDLGSNASDQLVSSFAKREEIDSVLVLYFNTLYAPAPFADGRLLNLVQALESYHRRVIGGSDLPKAEHQERVKAVLASVPSDLTEWWISNSNIVTKSP